MAKGKKLRLLKTARYAAQTRPMLEVASLARSPIDSQHRGRRTLSAEDLSGSSQRL